MTSNRDIPFAKSLIDYIFCWLGCQFIPGYADKNLPNRTPATPENKTTTTARMLVEKTKDLADKIAEAKAAGNNGSGKKKATKHGNPKAPAGNPEIKSIPVIHTDRLAEAASRIGNLVGVTMPAEGHLQAEAATMHQFNSQFAHFGDDATACDICGSITVRNGTCYKCFNCGNSMGCS
jgi:ribonucleoside-diphosphate reductase alpha chain